MNSSNSSIQSSSANQISQACQAEPPSLSLVRTWNKYKSDRPTSEQKKTIAQIYIEQALIYLNKCDWNKAIVACKNSLDIVPDNANAYKILGDILYRQGRQGDALGIYAKALAIDPDLASIYANVGTIYADRAKWTEALDYYQQAIILDPNLAGTYRNLAQVWEELGDTDKALECLCRAINLEPAILGAEEYFDFGRELYQQGKVKEASILFIHGVKLAPQAEAELAQLVQILEELEEWQQAVIYYHQLISLPDSDVDCSAALVVPNSSSGKERKPIRKLLFNSKNRSRSQSQLDSQEVAAKNSQTEIPLLPQNVARKLLPKATAKSDRSIEKDYSKPKSNNNSNLSGENDSITPPQNNTATSWNNLGSSYAQQKQWQKAIVCYQKSLKLEPNFAKSYRNLAKVYSNLGEESQAVLLWYEALAIDRNGAKPEEYFTLAKKLVQHQQVHKAIACLHRTIELKPDFEQARLALNKLENQRF